MTCDGTRCPVVVMISGRGSNLQALIDGQRRGTLPIELVAVVSDQPSAEGLRRAAEAGIPRSVVARKDYSQKAAFEQALLDTVDALEPSLVVLGGFMQILSETFVDRYAGRLLNVHPSLLPKYPGLNTHGRAIQAGDREHGASVHFVTHEVDAGPVVIQSRVPVLDDDTPEKLAARVLTREHQILPLVVRWYAEAQLSLVGATVHFRGRPLLEPLQYETDESAITG